MPELPEVETVRRYLEDTILNQKVNKVTLYAKKSLRNVPQSKLNNLIGEKIISLDRKAKHLIIRFDNHYLILHLRMEGKIFFVSSKEELKETKKSHLILTIETNKGYVVFKDFRLFATVDMFDNHIDYKDNELLSKVADEPWDLKVNELKNKLSKKRVAIKGALLDQSVISGLGNIYVDEVLHYAGLLPETPSNEIGEDDIKLIHKGSIKILRDSIKVGGTSIHSFTYGGNIEGGYYNKLKVHGQKECKTCGNTIIKTRVAGRGTYYCNKCQN